MNSPQPLGYFKLVTEIISLCFLMNTTLSQLGEVYLQSQMHSGLAGHRIERKQDLESDRRVSLTTHENSGELINLSEPPAPQWHSSDSEARLEGLKGW